MKIEFAHFDISTNENELKQLLKQALQYKIDGVSVLPQYLRAARSVALDRANSIKLSCPVDYPLGVFDTKSKLSAIDQYIKYGAQAVDVVCPSFYLCNRKYDKFRQDIKSINDLCKDKGVELRYFLEYRIYTYELLYRVSQILLDFGVSTVFPSTGNLIDDINDNILASGLINKKVPKIKIICNGNVWLKHQVETINKANLHGIRVNSINALSLLQNN